MMAISGRPGSLHRATRARQGARDPVNRPGYRSGSYPARTKARRRTATNGRERASGSGRSPQGPARLGTHPDQPALVVIVDEYAEMPEEASRLHRFHRPARPHVGLQRLRQLADAGLDAGPSSASYRGTAGAGAGRM